VSDIALNHFDLILKRGEIPSFSCGEIIQHPHLMALPGQRPGQVRTYEACAACD